MKTPTYRDRGTADFNMTPMIDVVMLLIVFFLLAGHLSKQEVQLELELPKAESSELNEEDEQRRIVVNVLATGQIVFAGQEVDHEEFGRRVRAEQLQSSEPLEIRIRTDRGVPYEIIEPLLTACAKAGVWNVGFAVLRRE